MRRTTTRPSFHARIAARFTVLTLLMAGCVVPQQESAQPISVPDDVFITTTTSTTTSIDVEQDPERTPIFTVSLYWQFQDSTGATRLLRVRRNQDDLSSPADTLDALIAGPTAEERELREEDGAFFPRVNEVLSPEISETTDDGLVRILVADEAGFRENDLEKIPIAEELVCTLTSLPRVDKVVIEDSQGEIDLPDRESQTIIGAAARIHYDCDLVPDEVPGAETTTTSATGTETTDEADSTTGDTTN